MPVSRKSSLHRESRLDGTALGPNWHCIDVKRHPGPFFNVIFTLNLQDYGTILLFRRLFLKITKTRVQNIALTVDILLQFCCCCSFSGRFLTVDSVTLAQKIVQLHTFQKFLCRHSSWRKAQPKKACGTFSQPESKKLSLSLFVSAVLSLFPPTLKAQRRMHTSRKQTEGVLSKRWELDIDNAGWGSLEKRRITSP